MSWKAKRFAAHTDRSLKLVPIRTSRHHVPPRHPDPQPRFIKVIDDRHHRAYHLLFGAAKSFEDACEILLRDWWTPPAEK